ASFDLPSEGRFSAGEGTENLTDSERISAVQDWYVPLRVDDAGVFHPVGARTAPPAKGPYLRGTYRFSYGGSSSRLDFGPGLERFYVRENAGRSLEDAARSGRIEAIVKVWRGCAVIVSLDMKPRN
ncbi:MAG: GDYXXLXY domain-containing protein, partial [Fretibacterium sp.]|nr:GDYXXLXY domain-containing protein [Fretibacterium sp.]